MTSYQFEKRAGSPGYVFGKSAEGKPVEIYIQYSHPAAVARDNGIGVEEATEMVAQARAFDLAPVTVKTAPVAEATPVEVPANVAALIARYGSSEAAWEDENEGACFAMRAYGY